MGHLNGSIEKSNYFDNFKPIGFINTVLQSFNFNYVSELANHHWAVLTMCRSSQIIIGPILTMCRSSQIIIGPFFFSPLAHYVLPQMREKVLENFCYMPHSNCNDRLFASYISGPNVKSKNGDIDWAPKSPDLTPPDYFL